MLWAEEATVLNMVVPLKEAAGSVASAKETALKLALATFKAPKKVMDSAV